MLLHVSPVLRGSPAPSALCGWGVWLELWQCQLLRLGGEVVGEGYGEHRAGPSPPTPPDVNTGGSGTFFLG